MTTFTAAIDIIRDRGNDCSVGIDVLLAELGIPLTPEITRVLALIDTLSAHPHIELIQTDPIGFAWNAIAKQHWDDDEQWRR